jgi:hypothetical protein
MPLPERSGLRVGWIIGGVLAAVVIFISILAALLLPALQAAKQRSQEVLCRNNLSQLGRAICEYSVVSDDILPWQVGDSDPKSAWRDLGLLYSARFIESSDCFICPASPDEALSPGFGPEGEFRAFGPSDVISYAYTYDSRPQRVRSWHLVDVGNPGSLRLIADKKAGVDETGADAEKVSHRARGRSVVYVDGRVEWKMGVEALDPDEDSPQIGAPGAKDYGDWWSDPPYYGE